MRRTRHHHYARRAAGTVLAALVLAVGLVTAQARVSAAAGAGPEAADALAGRVRAQLAVFTGWLAANGVQGAVGEVGWPNGADADRWNSVARQWYTDADAAGLWTTAWATGEWWGSSYKLSTYTWNTPVTMDGPLSVARSQAPVVEAQSADRRGVNVAGGEFGTPGPLESTSSFSNANPGAYDRAYHYDTQASFDYLAGRGITVVRMPFRWERIQPRLGQALDAAEVQRLAAAVGRAGSAGLRVILDVHNYGAYWLSDGARGVRRPIGSAEVTIAHFADLWAQLSDHFRHVPAVVAYGLMNEPAAMPAPPGLAPARAWEAISQAALTAIRERGDTKLVLVPGYNWSGAQQWTSQHPAAWIVDPAGNHRYEAHHYWDGDNSGAYAATYDAELAAAVGAGYTAPAPSSGAVVSFAGTDRIQTAIEISRSTFPAGSATAVTVARSDAFADALAGGPLAAAEGGPLLLTPPSGLDLAVQAEVLRVLPPGGAVNLLGGPAALPASLEFTLGALGYRVRRFAGRDRFETAVAIARDGLNRPGLVLLASGTDFPDALAGAAAAAHVGAAVLLTDGARMAPATAAYLQAAAPQRIALGGPARAADPGAEAVVGVDRFDTAAKVAARFFPQAQVVGLASGRSFADALAGGVRLARLGGPLLLSEPDFLPEPTRRRLAALAPPRLELYGGGAALGAAVRVAAEAALS